MTQGFFDLTSYQTCFSEWIKHYIALYCVLLYTQSALQSCVCVCVWGGGGGGGGCTNIV